MGEWGSGRISEWERGRGREFYILLLLLRNFLLFNFLALHKIQIALLRRDSLLEVSNILTCLCMPGIASCAGVKYVNRNQKAQGSVTYLKLISG